MVTNDNWQQESQKVSDTVQIECTKLNIFFSTKTPNIVMLWQMQINKIQDLQEKGEQFSNITTSEKCRWNHV